MSHESFEAIYGNDPDIDALVSQCDQDIKMQVNVFNLQMVWPGERLQCSGDGSSGSITGGLVQFLFKTFYHEDSADAGRPDDRPH